MATKTTSKAKKNNELKGEKIMSNKEKWMVTINTGKNEIVKELSPITIAYRTTHGIVPVDGYAISEDVSVFPIPRIKGDKVYTEYRMVLTKCGLYVPKKNGGDYKSIEGAVQYGHRHALHEKNENLEKYNKECKALVKALKDEGYYGANKTKKSTKKTASKKATKKASK